MPTIWDEIRRLVNELEHLTAVEKKKRRDTEMELASLKLAFEAQALQLTAPTG